MSYQELTERYQEDKKVIAVLLSEYNQYCAKLKQSDPREHKEIYTKIKTIKEAIRNIFNKISERFTFHKGLNSNEAIKIDRQIARFLGLNETWTF